MALTSQLVLPEAMAEVDHRNNLTALRWFAACLVLQEKENKTIIKKRESDELGKTCTRATWLVTRIQEGKSACIAKR